MDIYRSIFQQDKTAWLLFKQDVLVDANAAALAMIERALDELKGRRFDSLFPEYDENKPTDIETLRIDDTSSFSAVLRYQQLTETDTLVSIRVPLLSVEDLSVSEQVADVLDFREKLQSLNAVSLILASSMTLDDLYRQAVVLGREKLGIDRLGILLVDVDKQEQYGTWGTDTEGNLKNEQDWRSPLGNTPWVNEALADPEYCHFWEDIDLLNYGQVVGRGWSAMANLFDGNKLIGWIAADNLMTQQPLTPALQQLFRLYALSLSQLILRKQSELDLIAVNENLEQAVEKKTQDLEQQLLELQRMQRQLIEQEKHASLGNLVAGVAHEINTPLGNSLMSLSHLTYLAQELKKDMSLGLLTRTKLSETADGINESAELLNSNLQRAIELVQSFKQLASDQVDDHVAVINLHDVIDNVFASFHSQFKNRPIECLNQVDAGLRFMGSPAAFTQIATNLFDNGLRHAFDDKILSHRKGRIGFSASLNGTVLTLTYRDNGHGIDEALLSRIFEPLQTSNRGKSQGLGLTVIDKRVREDLKGTIRVENAKTGGAVFTLVCDVIIDET